MNYWTELGWMIVPMTGIEIAFALIMCLGSHLLDKRNR